MAGWADSLTEKVIIMAPREAEAVLGRYRFTKMLDQPPIMPLNYCGSADTLYGRKRGEGVGKIRSYHTTSWAE